MPKQPIFVGSNDKQAIEFLTAYFSDTQSIPVVFRSPDDFLTAVSLDGAGIVFLQADWVRSRFSVQAAQMKTRHPASKWFALDHPENRDLDWEAEISLPIEEREFSRRVLSHVQLPHEVKLVVVDDEPDISEMVRDYFEVRKNPEFKVRTALNGLEGFKLISEDCPHCLILDIKMPVRTGAELYRDLAQSGRRIPTIIFIDSTAAEDILEIRKWGNPVFAEKGGHYSSMPDMLALVKKLVAFS